MFLDLNQLVPAVFGDWMIILSFLFIGKSRASVSSSNEMFYFQRGSAQLVGHFLPNSVRDEKILRENSEDFLYFSSINFIKEVR